MTRKGYLIGTHRATSPEETMQRAGTWMEHVGITRLADITGLDRIGIPVMAAYRPDARSVTVSLGKGVTKVAAQASAIMESIELWHAEHPGLERHWGTANELSSRWRLADWWNLPAPLGSAFDAATPTAWVEAESLPDGQTALVPFEAVHTDGSVPEPAGSGWFLCTSNGLASGNNVAEAQVHALCELVERDAVTLWRSIGDTTSTLIAPDTVTDPVCRRLLERFEVAKISVVLQDATTDIGIPVVLCTIFDARSDPALQMGMGCHPCRDVAMSRALTEAAQSRLTLISGARDDLFREKYAPLQDAASLIEQFKSQLDAARHAEGFDRLPDIATDSLEDDRDVVVDALRARGLHPHWVNLSHPNLGAAVVRALVPGLEPPSDLARYCPGVRSRSAPSAR
jgi:ribosomal protein S12 methylthiotransferase accessory factor